MMDEKPKIVATTWMDSEASVIKSLLADTPRGTAVNWDVIVSGPTGVQVAPR